MFPANTTLSICSFNTLYINVVVVLFPFVPVIPITFWLLKSNNSSSWEYNLSIILDVSITLIFIPGVLIIISYCSRLSR